MAYQRMSVTERIEQKVAEALHMVDIAPEWQRKKLKRHVRKVNYTKGATLDNNPKIIIDPMYYRLNGVIDAVPYL